MRQGLLLFYSKKCINMDIDRCSTLWIHWFVLPISPAAHASESNSPLTEHDIMMSICIQKLQIDFLQKRRNPQLTKWLNVPKKLINQLTKWVNMLKGCLHQGGKSLWVHCMSVYYVKFYFSHICIHPFCPINYKKLQNVFNVVTK